MAPSLYRENSNEFAIPGTHCAYSSPEVTKDVLLQLPATAVRVKGGP